MLLFGVATVVGIAVTAALGRFATPDRWEYSVIAQNILDGNGAFYPFLGTKYFFYGSALYPRVMAAVLAVTGGSEGAILLLQCVVFALSCVLVERIGRKALCPVAAGLAAILATFHPGALVYVGRLHSQTFDATLLIALFLFLLGVTVRTTVVRALGVGALAGLAVSSRGTVLLSCVAWGMWFVFRNRHEFGPSVRVVGAIAVGGLVVLSPIWIEGYARHGELIALRTDNGVNLWTGNHEEATGTSFTSRSTLTPALDARPPSLVQGIEGMNEIEQNRAFTDASIRFARSNPSQFVALFFRKLGYFWWFTPHTGALYPDWWLSVYRIYYLAVLPLAIVGLFAALRSRDERSRLGAQTFLVVASTMSASQALFYVDGRHRWELEPLLLVFVAGGVLYLARLLKLTTYSGFPAMTARWFSRPTS